MSVLSQDSSVMEIMKALPIRDVYRLAHNHEHGVRPVLNEKKTVGLWFPGTNVQRLTWRMQNASDEQKKVETCLLRVVEWMKSHPVETELFLIEKSPSLAVDLATKSGYRSPARFDPENEKRFFQKCVEKRRYNLAIVRYCDRYKLFAPNMEAIMLEAGYGEDYRFKGYIRKIQRLKRDTAQMLGEFLKFRGINEEVTVRELIENLVA